jgi:2-hydroxy-6-oxonona-2,4-dienedioate hydrolase
MRESEAVINHDCMAGLSRIKAPTQITFGRFDMVTSTRFADALHDQIKGSELHVFEDCAHAPIYENIGAFNSTTLAFLQKHSG